jgi:REP element-mobilizing transposase RayT/CheY-like chemotaxis protein
MTANILVATPKTAVGELLRLSLEESGRYRVRLAQTPGEVQSACGRVPFDLVILDASLDGDSLAALVQALRTANPSLRLVVIPPDNDPSRLEPDGLRPDAFLSLPFYTPELLETVGSLLAVAGHGSRQPAGESTPLALGEKPEVEELLGFLIGDTSARVIFILRQRSLWASAGQIDPSGLQELAGTLGRAWVEGDSSDLARFTRLAQGGDVLLYATLLEAGTLLALVFDPTIPLMRVRSQVSQLAQLMRAVHAPPVATTQPSPMETGFAPAGEVQPPSQAAAGEGPLPGLKVSDEELAELMSADAPSGKEAEDLLLALQQAAGIHAPLGPVPEPPAEKLVAGDAGKLPARDHPSSGEEESPEVSLTDLLAAMPPPNPEERSLAPGSEWIEGEEKEAGPDGFLFPWEMETQTIALRSAVSESAVPAPPAVPRILPADQNGPVPPPPGAESQAETSMDAEAGRTEEVTRQSVSPTSVTQPASTPAAGTAVPVQPLSAVPDLWSQAEELESPPAEFASLSYTCIMLPRLPTHLLTGRLARKLAESLKQICLAYGWLLEAQAVRPDYFQWTVQVSPVISPSSVVRLVRLQTSQRIFDAFGRYAAAIPSGDFWAPGYLIVSGSQPPETGMIQDYIQQTRKRQGL